ncbi:adenylyltransferase/cytidyltransferase family protein [Deinococcus peraridilitoris]|uniref:Cytidyltransferase-related enzyme n=1 Tax=Deinococcus peraridilitoris (strain DSM 19664 / LMG 22246 / CIP 109416 / KR-200) TaxID=937777 RepID=L0A6K6_DEIPD|nr:adenylyltransferase/cytidyltransferase family protein [Deinococcus peraridilitoris]AFZ68817.1 cytidyltransferase-related enzyme [Deinococcus peraridilitoris DSM 19664]
MTGVRLGVYIGRFQPLHNAHQQVMLEALSQVEQLVVILGSARAARSIKNPFTVSERQDMITAALQQAGVAPTRLHFMGVRDFWDTPAWASAVREAVSHVQNGAHDLILFGHEKDASSAYLREFPDWTFRPTQVRSALSATPLRRAWLRGDWVTLEDAVPSAVLCWLRDFARRAEYAALQEEALALHHWRAAWTSAPHTPTFVSAHALVQSERAVLLHRRVQMPGRSLWQLPGGLLHPQASLRDSATRHLREQTGLDTSLPPPEIVLTFDHPERSLLGREVAYVHAWRIPHHRFAASASSHWLHDDEALAQPEQFYADHYRLLELTLERLEKRGG